MKKILLAIFTFGMISTSMAQMGVGIGTAGLNIKSDPDKTFALLFRQNASFGNEQWRFSSELNGVAHLVNKSDIKFYIGLGGGLDFGKNAGSNKIEGNTYIKFPVGLEYFLSDRWSIAVESGFSYFLTQKLFGRGLGLFELTYYFGR
jgi:hypothetical protein